MQSYYQPLVPSCSSVSNWQGLVDGNHQTYYAKLKERSTTGAQEEN